MDSNHFCHFWNSPYVQRILYFSPLIYCKNTLKDTKIPNHFQKYDCSYLKIAESPKFGNVGKDGHRKMMKIRQTNSWKSWIWDQPIFTSKPECNFGSMGPISTRKHEMDFWYFEINKKSWGSMFENLGKPGGNKN